MGGTYINVETGEGCCTKKRVWQTCLVLQKWKTNNFFKHKFDQPIWNASHHNTIPCKSQTKFFLKRVTAKLSGRSLKKPLWQC